MQPTSQASPSYLTLPLPVLPLARTSATNSSHRHSVGSTLSRVSTDSIGSLHIVKRHTPDPDIKRKQRWSIFKWWLLGTNTLLFIYGLGILILSILTFFKFYLRADVFIVGERVILNMITATGVLCLGSSLLGYTGIMLNHRGVLAVYNVLLWVCFSMIAAIGYVAYRKSKWNIEGKLSYQWHYDFTKNDRMRVQANLHCCGYKEFADFHEQSSKCFPRTILPGCRYKYQEFTKQALATCWVVAFSLVPGHILILVSALLCSNHINVKFGKGLPPKIYRPDYQGIVEATSTSTGNSSSVKQ